MWPYVKESRPNGGLAVFCVALYEVHMSNFGGSPLYLDIQQHREALLGDVAATMLAAFCGLLCAKGSWSRGFRMVGLTSALGVSCGLIWRDLDLIEALSRFMSSYMKSTC